MSMRRLQESLPTPARWWSWVLMAGLIYSVLLLYSVYAAELWIIGKNGGIIATDYLAVYGTGLLIWNGDAALAYDWTTSHQVQQNVVGLFGSIYGWHYPPPFLFVATLTILLPYLQSWLAWLLISASLCILAMRPLMGWRWAVLLTLSFPAACTVIRYGQNGFLTTALIAGCLLLWEKRPVWSAILLGLLSYKPQFGVPFPIALLIERRWRMLLIAGLTVVILVGLTLLAFGVEPWRQFVVWLPITNKVVLGLGAAGLRKLQSVEAWLRVQEVPLPVALGLHLVWVALLLVWMAWIRRAPRHADMAPAALGVAAIAASPYIYMYDLMALVVPFGLCLRSLFREGGRWFEHAGLLAVCFAMHVEVLVGGQEGLLAILLLMAVITWRAKFATRRAPIQAASASAASSTEIADACASRAQRRTLPAPHTSSM